MTDATSTAHRILAEVADLAPDEVVVLGDGDLAELLRAELGATGGLDPARAPLAVIDAAGTSDGIVRAIETVASGGRVVLAVQPQQPFVDVRTYSDIHARGLTIVGVPADD